MVLLSLPILVSSTLLQMVTSSSHSTTNKSEIENLTIADATIPTIDSKTLNNIGNNLSSQGKYKLAHTFYDRALAVSPSNLKALIDNAEVLSKWSRYEDATNTYNKALYIQPSNLTILFDKAIPYFDKILYINSSDSGLLVVASTNKQFALYALKNAENDVQ